MMTLDDFDRFCANLREAAHVVQWGGASVWKVRGKVFAIGGWSDSPQLAITFKCPELSFAILKDQSGLRPAPYLASRGLSWMQRVDDSFLSDAELEDYVRQGYKLVVATLPKKTRSEMR